jgi:hypothetical protein
MPALLTESDRVPATPGRRDDRKRGIRRSRSHRRRRARALSTAPAAAVTQPVATEENGLTALSRAGPRCTPGRLQEGCWRGGATERLVATSQTSLP